MTQRIYYQNTYSLSESALLIAGGQDDHGCYWIFDQTIFHPQGGGQPSDRGTILLSQGSIAIFMVKEIDGEIRHYGTADVVPDAGDRVQQSIDGEFRLLCAKLHSAGHLLAHIIQEQNPSAIPIKAFHFPEGPYIEIAGSIPPDLAPFFQQKVDAALNLPVTSAASGSIRQISIGDFQSVSCGGTHVKNTSEIGRIIVRGIKKSGQNTKVKYALEPAT